MQNFLIKMRRPVAAVGSKESTESSALSLGRLNTPEEKRVLADLQDRVRMSGNQSASRMLRKRHRLVSMKMNSSDLVNIYPYDDIVQDDSLGATKDKTDRARTSLFALSRGHASSQRKKAPITPGVKLSVKTASLLSASVPLTLSGPENASMDDKRLIVYRRLQRAVDSLNLIIRSNPSFSCLYYVNREIIKTVFMQLVPLYVGIELYSLFSHQIHSKWLCMPPSNRRIGVWTARQAGKTTALAICIAVALNCIHVSQTEAIACYSASKQQAAAVARAVSTAYDILLHNAESFNEKRPASSKLCVRPITRLSSEQITVSGFDYGFDSLRLSVHSSSVNTNRGENAVWIVCDEFCFIKYELYVKHLTAVMSVSERFITLTTTPGQPTEALTQQFMEWAHNPEKYTEWSILSMGLVCIECTMANTPLECRHRLHLVPPWKSIPLLFRQIECAVANQREIMTELLGLPTEHHFAVFSGPEINNLFCSNSVRWPRDTFDFNALFLVVDPASSSEKSHLALITCAYVDGVLAILGMEDCSTYRTAQKEWDDLVTRHMEAIYSTGEAALSTCAIVPVFECNMCAGVTNSMFVALASWATRRRVRVATVFYQKMKSAYTQYSFGGVWTDQNVKINGANVLRRRLHVGSIAFAEPFVCTGVESYRVAVMPSDLSVKTDAEKAAEMQMRLAQMEPVPVFSNAPVRRIRETLSSQLMKLREDDKHGISGKNSAGTQQDDLAIAMLLAAYFTDLAQDYISTDGVTGNESRIVAHVGPTPSAAINAVKTRFSETIL